LERQAQDIAAQIWDLESRLAMLRDQARSDLEAPRCWLGSVYST
jgi:cell division protein FtsB